MIFLIVCAALTSSPSSPKLFCQAPVKMESWRVCNRLLTEYKKLDQKATCIRLNP